MQDMPRHVCRSIYSVTQQGKHRYGADADWGVLDGVTLEPPGEYV